MSYTLWSADEISQKSKGFWYESINKELVTPSNFGFLWFAVLLFVGFVFQLKCMSQSFVEFFGKLLLVIVVYIRK